jgi:sulfatase maturation enzyme AslB (radical SAM superfamily)
MPDRFKFNETYIINDLVIQEDNCNFGCTYCLTGQSSFKDQHVNKLILRSPRQSSCLPGSDLLTRLQTIVEATNAWDVPVIKVSGGELFLVRGIDDFIAYLSRKFSTVVVMTNGLLLTAKRIKRLKQIENIVLQVSLDSTRYAGNSYRTPDIEVHRTLMNRIHTILQSGIKLEVYLVLHDRSIADIEYTLNDLATYAGQVLVFPFPVRGPDREKFLPRDRESYNPLERVVEHANRFGSILPAHPYLEKLWRVMIERERAFRCHLPRIAFTSFDDGTITSCPNIWFNKVGNIIESSHKEVLGNLTNSHFRKLLLSPKPRILSCKRCFSPWDVLSMYMEGELTLAELARIPMYANDRVLDRLSSKRRCDQFSNVKNA